MKITEQELEIFSRHLILKEFNEKSLKIFRKKKVTLVGIGGIGCPAAQYLISAGISKLHIIDGDIIKKNNLNRQILYSLKDVGKLKTEVAKYKLESINSDCNIKIFSSLLDKKNIDNNLFDSSLVIDATDNWKSMKLINKYCVEKSIPLISASVVGFDSQITLFKNVSKKHLCLQCIFPNNNEPEISRCETVGVLGTAAGITGLIAAQKTINFFLEKKLSKNQMTLVNTKSLKIDNLTINKNDNCVLIKKTTKTN
tara:strand:- start:1434 stop:2198 length:765 start_codon:yes stop_codon:yes gene_type:complete